MEDRQKDDGVIFNEIELHCIARHMQVGYGMQIGEHRYISPCFYCKHAFDCIEILESKKKLPVTACFPKISKAIGVFPALEEGKEHVSILEGSWIEEYPELLEEFSHLSIGEQADRLKEPDILQYRSAFREAKDGIGGK